ncbi:MAG: phage major capsid protein [Armatimonadetes bacterium]|nr:phage major capsid protein [Armatimonadota bacterium]
MSQYLLMEQEADDLLRKQKDILEAASAEKRDMTSGERDKFFQMQGAQNALEAQARALRDAELEDLRHVPDVPGIPAEDTAKADYMAFMRTGTEPKASVTTTDANGGYIVPEPVQGPLVELVREYNPIMANAQMFIMNGDVVMNLPRKVGHGAVTATTETGARSEQTAPTFGSVTLRAYDHYTDQRATQTWLDSVAGSEDLMLRWIYEDLFDEANNTMVNGSGGTTESAGVFANTGTSGYTQKFVGTEGALANTDFLQCVTGLHPRYRGPSKWYMNSTVLASIGNLAHPAAADTPLVNWSSDTPTLWGKPIIEVEDAPTTASGETFPVLFGDLSQAYAYGVHRNISILRDPYTAAPYIRFYGLARIGGAPWDRQAAILLKSDTA